MKIYGIIYKITNISNNKVYIGQTRNKYGFKGRYHIGGGNTNIERVHKHHGMLKKCRLNYNKYLYSSIEKYGYNSFKIEEEFDIAYSLKELNEKEKYWIKFYNSNNRKYGYNSTRGGEGVKGFHHSKETKEKLRRINIDRNYSGERHPMYGKHHSQETKMKIGSRKYKNSSEHVMARKVICLTTNKVFGCVRDAQKYYNIPESNIVKCCRHKRNSAGKYDGKKLVWEYLEGAV